MTEDANSDPILPIKPRARKPVPKGSYASVRAKLAAMYPDADPALLTAAATKCIRLSGPDFIDELGL